MWIFNEAPGFLKLRTSEELRAWLVEENTDPALGTVKLEHFQVCCWPPPPPLHCSPSCEGGGEALSEDSSLTLSGPQIWILHCSKPPTAARVLL